MLYSKGQHSSAAKATPSAPKPKSAFTLSSFATMVAVALLAVLFYAYRTTVAGTAACQATCEKLHQRFGSSVITLPEDAGYAALSEENWSQTAWMRPSCIAVPTDAKQVGSLVKLLADSQTPFAIRSGGHSPMPFDSNIDTGVLIYMKSFNQVSYDAKSGLVSMGPGARWGDVYTELDKHSVTLVGGRVMEVGVGGLTLGCGLSYLSDLYGLVCDNVVSYEVVLADGSVVEASDIVNRELFWALKGGANNFGVVTKFKSRTYPEYQGWGGIQIFSPDQMPAVLDALYDYQTQPDKDPYANLILNLLPTNGTVMLTLVYLKPEARPAAFAPFYALRPVLEQTDLVTLHQLMALFPPASLPRWTWHVHAFAPDRGLYGDLAALYAAAAPEVAAVGGLAGGTLIAAVQPIAAAAVRAGQRAGGGGGGVGNALGLRAVDQTWWSVSAAWWDAADDAAAYGAAASLAAKVRDAAAAADKTLDYLFMNDANINQSVIASYGEENVARLRAVQREYDPKQVFQRLVPGGQKLPH